MRELIEKWLPLPVDPYNEVADEDSAVAQDSSLEDPPVADGNNDPVASPQPAPHLTTRAPVVRQEPVDAPTDSTRLCILQVEAGGSSILVNP